MKHKSMLLLFCFAYFFSLAQSETTYSKQLVRVTDWTKKSYLFIPEFWDNKREEIVKQIGESEFEKVKKYSNLKFQPKQMSMFDGRRMVNPDSLNMRLEKLSVYKIATFRHIFQGKDWGERAILMVPYKGNENWDSTAKWDSVYFIIKSDFVEEIKQ